MSEDSLVAMTAEERDEFLDTGGAGVLSLAAGDEPPHSVPVSYGYDRAAESFYFRLAVGADSAKGGLAGRPVSFVTYGESGDGWQSVVASGQLADVESEGIEIETLNGLGHVDIPLVDIFERSPREITFEFYRLVPEELSGRAEP